MLVIIIEALRGSPYNQKTSNHMMGGYHSSRVSEVISGLLAAREAQTIVNLE